MKIIWLIRIRNEADIIKDTLDHLSTFCSWWIYVYDDKSTDSTIEIVKKHPAVKWLIEWTKWIKDREKAEYQNRQAILELAQKNATFKDWFVYIDADERVEFDWGKLKELKDVSWVKMKLFDFYITEEDKNFHYSKRKFIWPEYREILIIFKNSEELKYNTPDQREVYLWYNWRVIKEGFIKHYWKAISIEQWEETCEYYSKYFPKYSKKWNKRKWKAIHNKSDFWMNLIKWEEKEKKWIALWKVELKNQNLFVIIVSLSLKLLYTIKTRMLYLIYKIIKWKF